MEQQLTICIKKDRCEHFNELCETRDTQRIFELFKSFKADSCLPQFLQHDNTLAETAEQRLTFYKDFSSRSSPKPKFSIWFIVRL